MGSLQDRLREVVQDAPDGRLRRMREIAQGSGVSLKTVHNAYYGATSDMRHSNALRIERYLNENYGRREADKQQAAQRQRAKQMGD